MVRVPVVVDVEFDEGRRIYVPWRMFRGQESNFLRAPQLDGHFTVARTVYPRYSALGHEGRYELTVNLDDRQWTLVGVTDPADAPAPRALRPSSDVILPAKQHV